LKSSRGRRAETRVVAGGAVLLAICLCLVAVSLAGCGLSASSPTPSAAPPTPIAVATVQSLAPVTPSPTATPDPTTPPTPRPQKVAAQPTPDQRRVYNVPILMFHRVVPSAEAGDSITSLVVPPEVFAAQMKAFFDAGWHSITMATLVRTMKTNATIPPKTFVITFDDGWEDGYTYAFPVMKRFGFVATYFVVGGYINEKDMLSASELRELEAAGDDIGNHTENHASLTSTSLAHARLEVEQCSETIQRLTGHRPVSMAYPMGAISTAVAEVVSGVPDIQMAVTTGYGETQTWEQRYNTPRVRVNPTTDGPGLVASLTHPQS